MPRAVCICVAVLLTGSAPSAASDAKDIVGRWRWQDFTIEVVECQGDSICAKVTAGPKNVGLNVFSSKLVARGGEWFGQVTHPETKEVYNTRFQRKDQDHWRLDGCTAAKVCLSGDFVRVK